jgi:hypothetical protein
VLEMGTCAGSGYVPELVEVRIIKNKQKFVVLLDALDSMREALGEVPNISIVKLLDLVSAIFIYGGDENRPGVHETPFCLDMRCQHTQKSSQIATAVELLTTRCQ